MSRVTYTNTADRVDQEQLRVDHGVRLVTGDEEGTGVNALPVGVYGYTYSPGLPNAPLFAVRRYRSYETHKIASGEIVVIAYADVETAAKISSAADDVGIHVHAEAGCQHARAGSLLTHPAASPARGAQPGGFRGYARADIGLNAHRRISWLDAWRKV